MSRQRKNKTPRDHRLGHAWFVSLAIGSFAICSPMSVWAEDRANATDEMQTPVAFVRQYCIDCHGEDAQEADRRFDQLTERLKSDDLESWQEILDRLNIGDMPPEDAMQPDASERQAMVDRLTRTLADAVTRWKTSHQTALRRLNRREYAAAVKHVLGLESLRGDPTRDFPPDEKHHSFDNVGETLVTSDFLMQQYLAASDEFLRHARRIEDTNRRWESGEKLSRSWTFEAPFCRSRPNPDGMDVDGRFQHLRENPTDHDGYLYPARLRRGVPTDGRYRIRIRACGIDRDHPYSDDILQFAREDPLRMSLIATDAGEGVPESNHPTDQTITEWELPDDQPTWFETEAWLDAGWTFRLTFPNGPVRIKYMRHRLMREHRDLFPRYLSRHVNVFGSMHPDHDKAVAKRLEEAFLDQQDRFAKRGQPHHTFGTAHRMHTDEAWSDFYAEYRGPRVRVFEMQLVGPLRPDIAPEHPRWFGQQSFSPQQCVAQLSEFARRAYRRPIRAAEIEPFVSLAQSISSTESPSGSIGVSADAMHTAYQAILCSPAFTYHRTAAGPLSHHAFANRLAFFLSGRPADRRLMDLADRGELARRDSPDANGESAAASRRTLMSEVDRLIASDEFVDVVDRWAEAWFHLDSLGQMLPDRTEHPRYYNEQWERFMRAETVRYLLDAFRRDASPGVLIDSDYTFLNGPLSRLYGIDGVSGAELRRHALDGSVRGGLMTQASVLTASANGIDTSPVLRGVWVLECLLGTPPSPPPPDVEPIEPDTRGTTTIREQLAAHREVATCAACHAKIDPPGFALEQFDEVGRFRTRYERFAEWRNLAGPEVDPSGKLYGGHDFSDVRELKRQLTSRTDLVRQNLLSKLMVSATGRIDDPADRAEVARLARELEGAGMRQLIRAVVMSDAFAR